MQQVMYANGKLWGALDTAVTRTAVRTAPALRGTSSTRPRARSCSAATSEWQAPTSPTRRSGSRRAVAASWRSRTRATPTFPSAAYSPIDAQVGAGPWSFAGPGGQGAAADDGFSGYKAQRFPNPIRPRWGDYGAAAVDGNSIWIASEYIAHGCDYTTLGRPFFAGGSGDNLLGTCAGASHGPGGRTALANWSTRISKLTP